MRKKLRKVSKRKKKKRAIRLLDSIYHNIIRNQNEIDFIVQYLFAHVEANFFIETWVGGHCYEDLLDSSEMVERVSSLIQTNWVRKPVEIILFAHAP